MNADRTFQWIEDWGEILSDDFQVLWRQIYEADETNHVFYHPAVARAWIEAYRNAYSVEPFFGVSHSSDGGKVLMPMVILQRGPRDAYCRRLVPVGHGDYDYHDPVLSNVGEDIGDEFWNVYLEQLEQAATGRYDFVAINGIRGTFNSGRWQSDDVAPFISVSSATDVLAQLKRSLRGDIRRQRRRLEEVGMLSLKTFSSSEIDPALVVLAEFLEAHSTRWPNSFRVPTLHERLVEYGLHAGVAHFSVLNLDGEPISWHLGFNDARRFYWYMPVYKEQYAAFSPGKLHLAAFVETAHATGARTVDLLRGDESYKSDWATGNEALHCTSRWSGSPTSRIRKCLLTTGKPLVQRMKRLIAPDSGTSPTAVDMELARRANLHAPLSAPNSLW